MKNVYDFLEPHEFLAFCLDEKRTNNPSFSLRSWALQLGMKSHGPLHAMLKGQRNIPKKYVPLFVKNLKLNQKEADYFETLVDLQRAKTQEEKELYLQRLQDFGPQVMRKIADVEAYKYITDPVHLILSEMVELKDFQNKVGWIKNKLRFNLSMLEIEEVLGRLVRLGVLKETDSGYSRTVQHIYTAKEKMSEAIQMYHKKMGKLAIEQVSSQDIDTREFNAITFNIEKKNLAKIKEKIRLFTDNLIQEYEASPNEGDETYHMNIQLFSLTK